MKTTLNLILLILFLQFFQFDPISAQPAGSQKFREILTRNIWTDGFEFVRYITPDVHDIMGIPNPSTLDADLLFMAGGSLHEGGTHICLEQNGEKWTVTDRHTDPYQWFPIGCKAYLDKTHCYLYFRHPQTHAVCGTLTTLDSPDALSEMMRNDMRTFALAGRYTDKDGNSCTFSAKKNLIESEIYGTIGYTFSEVCNMPAMILCIQNHKYKVLSCRQWLLLKPVHENEEEFTPSEGSPEILLQRVNDTEQYDFPLISSEILTAQQILLYAGRSAISYGTEDYTSSVNRVLQTLRTMANETYARHGYIFKSARWTTHFSNRPWYTPRHTNVDSLLTETERINVEHIRYLEHKMRDELNSSY